MYNKLLYPVFFIGLNISICFGQECFRNGEFMDGPDYPVKGGATLLSQPGKNLVLKFTDEFKTEAGPDLDVYLSNTPKPDSNSKNISDLKSPSGAQEYEIPEEIKLDSYKYILIHCTQFNHFWGNAELGEKMGDCTTTGIEINPGSENSDIKIIRNNNQVNISLNNTNDDYQELFILDLNGKKIANIKINSGNSSYTLESASFRPGLYIVELIGNRNRKFKKIFLN